MGLEPFIYLFSFLSAIGSLLAGIGTLQLARIGNNFREDKKFQHQFNTAKEAIDIFNEVKSNIQEIRKKCFYSEEYEKAAQEYPDMQKMIESNNANSDYVVTAFRFNKFRENILKMEKLKPIFKAVFEEIKPFNEMRLIWDEVGDAIIKLTLTPNRQKSKNEEIDATFNALKNKREAIIWSKNDDDINKRMNEAVKCIEEICTLVLRNER